MSFIKRFLAWVGIGRQVGPVVLSIEGNIHSVIRPDDLERVLQQFCPKCGTDLRNPGKDEPPIYRSGRVLLDCPQCGWAQPRIGVQG